MSAQTVLVSDGGTEVTQVSRRNGRSMIIHAMDYGQFLKKQTKEENRTHRSVQRVTDQRFACLMVVKSHVLLWGRTEMLNN